MQKPGQRRPILCGYASHKKRMMPIVRQSYDLTITHTLYTRKKSTQPSTRNHAQTQPRNDSMTLWVVIKGSSADLTNRPLSMVTIQHQQKQGWVSTCSWYSNIALWTSKVSTRTSGCGNQRHHHCLSHEIRSKEPTRHAKHCKTLKYCCKNCANLGTTTPWLYTHTLGLGCPQQTSFFCLFSRALLSEQGL